MISELRELVISELMLELLPEPVQRYMHWADVIGKPWIHTAFIRQEGQFRLGLDRPWMPLKAEQIFTVDPPGLSWQARLWMFGLPLMRARDTYKNGQAHMHGKLAGLFTIFDAHDEALTLGTQMRYLSEMIWFPTAFLGDNITWKAVDDDTADVAFTDHSRTVSGRMTFDELGRPMRFETTRYMEREGGYVLTPWRATNLEYGRRGGLNIPVRSQASWTLPEGELTYGDFNIVEAAYNRPGEVI